MPKVMPKSDEKKFTKKELEEFYIYALHANRRRIIIGLHPLSFDVLFERFVNNERPY